ncbi:hypothetical protein XA68_14851 [Ophiocordyceps unilateralis]|uniref:Uncharacterized protein n=1 Tax=Ophiocordyceps unilateralis TaxID=268505 RepID=A0A2A9P9K6_OPHUN|nr:hypothetical protein XA68_14851 [Ophiocordyceps unilateralis]
MRPPQGRRCGHPLASRHERGLDDAGSYEAPHEPPARSNDIIQRGGRGQGPGAMYPTGCDGAMLCYKGRFSKSHGVRGLLHCPQRGRETWLNRALRPTKQIATGNTCRTTGNPS